MTVSAPEMKVAGPEARAAMADFLSAFEAYKQVVLEVLEPPAEGWVKVRHRDGQQGYARVAHLWGVQ